MRDAAKYGRTVGAGNELDLGFGIYVVRGEPDFDALYRDYLVRVKD